MDANHDGISGTAKKASQQRQLILVLISLVLVLIMVSLDSKVLHSATGSNDFVMHQQKQSQDSQQQQIIVQRQMIESLIRPTLLNYTEAQGLDAVEDDTPRIMDANETKEYLAHYGFNADEQKIVYFIMPTYRRLAQMADLMRVSHTLQLDRAVYWICIEDSETHMSKRVRDLLDRSGLPYAHTHVATSTAKEAEGKRGVDQRNAGIDIALQLGLPGTVYFGDDDNAFDTRLLPQLRDVRKVGATNVAFAGGMYERCNMNVTTGKVDNLIGYRGNGRKFKIDMAGFGVNIDLLREKNSRFLYSFPKGKLEDFFLQTLIESIDDFEPMGECLTMYAWHVKTKVGNARTNANEIDETKHDLMKAILTR